MLRAREGDVERGIPIDAKVGRVTFAEAGTWKRECLQRFSIVCSAGLQACCTADLKVCTTYKSKLLWNSPDATA
jgi:hypothetical protein